MSLIVDLIPLDSTIKVLIDSYTELRAQKKKEELETPEWKAIEKAYLDHLKWRFAYPKKVFGQQIFANWLITFLVITLVICGLVFSFLQLTYALKAGDLSSLKSEIEIQTAGKISMSSSIVGAVTLVISLIFFFLYLKYVFEIRHPVPPHVALPDGDVKRLLEEKDVKGMAQIDLKDLKILDIKKG
jgi:hypothetical protein